MIVEYNEKNMVMSIIHVIFPREFKTFITMYI